MPVVAASWAVLELALRVPGRRLGTAVAALCVVHLADDWRLLPGETAGWRRSATTSRLLRKWRPRTLVRSKVPVLEEQLAAAQEKLRLQVAILMTRAM